MYCFYIMHLTEAFVILQESSVLLDIIKSNQATCKHLLEI